ncbi:MAG TPA: hypothetical protein DEA80_01635 [Afipia sp.]|mgnify:CR=1 FL=1|uniref:hypothetical protein n=1 Tax=unclassified Afipia TaxID=2642050 RepID=UPI0004AF9D60|nr:MULTISPECIES: hypothetical protein [unclassified Afipia]MAH71978.1 hypothetical protein [Afipia sp.]OUX59008.1 MAG: hypothetical protein CBB64_22490 [Afipia sp. TMED4]HAO40598.1 hypothetical protein [Afipia sp.]HAP49251.1 hypothetical protein [Afipia sp.]HAQ92393.1 hypothetical protein [Afipia sp.]
MTTQSTSITPGIADLSAPRTASSSKGLLAEIAEFWRTFIRAAFDPYHPERHYMRGPGPACARKLGKTAK